MDKKKTETAETVKAHVDAAFAALCKISVSGPLAIPYAKAVAELAAAGVALEAMKKTESGKDGGGET